MALQPADIDQIIQHIKPQFNLWLADRSLDKPSVLYEIELRERIVRVEEELKHQRELMQQGFALMQKQFEQMDKRFEQITQRIDRFMFWSLAITITSAGTVISAIKLWH